MSAVFAMNSMVKDLLDEADLCRNETATDIADLLERAVKHITTLELRLAEMELVAMQAHRLAINLECMCLDPVQSYNAAGEAIQTYYDAIEKIYPQAPSFMGEPFVDASKRKPVAPLPANTYSPKPGVLVHQLPG